MTQDDPPALTIHDLAKSVKIADRTMYAIAAKYFASLGTTPPLRRRRGRLTVELSAEQAQAILNGYHLAKARGLSYEEVYRSQIDGQKIPQRPNSLADLVYAMEQLEVRMQEVQGELSEMRRHFAQMNGGQS